MIRTNTAPRTISRRSVIGMGIGGSFLVAAVFSTGIAQAATPVVEIIAFSHPPVASALKPLRDWLGTQGGKVKVLETDVESPAGVQRLQAVGIKGHVPIVILVNGQHQYKRADGRVVDLTSFPSGPSAPAGFQGGWTLEDAKTAIGSVVSR